MELSAIFRAAVLGGAITCAWLPAVACSSGANAAGDAADTGDELKKKDGGTDAHAADGASTSAAALGPNDVSILWPVPEDATAPLPSGYLKVRPAAGERGPAVPDDPSFPALHGDVPSSISLAKSIIVAMRIDPCAATDSGGCARELRLSAQPIAPQLDTAAMHLIYRLDDARFRELVRALATWRTHSPVPTGDRLGVHPGLAKAGVGSPFARELGDIVVRFATDAALVRVTFSSFAFDQWHFTRRDRAADGSFVTMPLANLPPDSTAESWAPLTQKDELLDTKGTFAPTPLRNYVALLGSDPLANPAAPDVLAARDAVSFFENPTQSNAETVDCASCHMADAVHRWSERHGLSFDTPTAYRAPAGLDVTRTDVPDVLRGNVWNTVAFGYHHVQKTATQVPVATTRVANETSEVLRRLAAEGLLQ